MNSKRADNNTESSTPGRIVQYPPILGCDIGNGFGYVSAVFEEDKDPRILFPASSGFNSFGMPTTAYVTPPEGDPIVVCKDGKPAERVYQRDPEHLVRAVKTQLENNMINLPGIQNPVRASDIYGTAAADLVALAGEALPSEYEKQSYRVVFAFPAAFSDNPQLLDQMQRSIEAKRPGQKFTVEVAGRLPEPAAVAIDYLHYVQHVIPEGQRIKEDNYTVLVYDLGYGTFDTAVVTASSKNQPYILYSKDGLKEVGGKDFDDILFNEICKLLKKQYGYVPQNGRQREAILTEAINVKIALTDNSVETCNVMGPDGDYLQVEITRERFEELSSHLLDQTLQLVDKVMNDALRSGIKINAVVLSGGASQMPMVKKGLEQLLENKYPVYLYRPSQAVSFGAARYGYQQILRQFTDCCYGLWMPSKTNAKGEIRFMIQSGEERPAVSAPLQFYSSSSRLRLEVYRSKAKNQTIEKAEVEDCESVIRLPFDVTPGALCSAVLKVSGDYSVSIELTTDQDEKQVKNSSDSRIYIWNQIIY